MVPFLLVVLWYLAVASLLCYALSFFFEAFANIIYKERLFLKGVVHMLFSTDKKWKRLPDPATVSRVRSKQVIFVRHGESAWNVVFNRGFGASFPGRLLSAVFDELRVLPTLDSVFVDSPLSVLGCRQAQELQNFVETHPLLRGSEGKSVVACSNLRRAVSTATIGFLPRLKRTQERIHILSSLQEVTFNIDGLSLAKPQCPPVLSDDEVHAIGGKRADFHPERVLDASENSGDKAVRGRGISRMQGEETFLLVFFCSRNGRRLLSVGV